MDWWQCIPEPLSPLKRLGHEGYSLTVAVGNVLDDILEPLQLVSHVNQGGETHVDFSLTTSSNLVMLALDADSNLLKFKNHLITQVILRVNRRTGEVAFLVTRLVAQVGELFTAGVPGAFGRIYRVEGLVALES